MTDAVLHLFLATDLVPVGRETHGPEEDHSEVVELPLAHALEMVVTGEIVDAKTVIGLLFVDRELRRGGVTSGR
jgi:ADP-ribose pyrophosphatase